jgi:hypothetical protein
MAAIAGYGYTIVNRRTLESSPPTNEVVVDLQLGNGTDTYPTGGLAINGASIGLPNLVSRVEFLDSPITGGYFPRLNRTSGKIELLANTGTEIANSATPNALFRVVLQGY